MGAMSHVIRTTSRTIVRAYPVISSARLVLVPISMSTRRLHVEKESSFQDSHKFSAVAKKLVKVLKSEMKTVEPKTKIDATPPPDFPFKIEQEYSSIQLKGKLCGENITVSVKLWPRGKRDDQDYHRFGETANDNNSSQSTHSTDHHDEVEEKSNNNAFQLDLKIDKEDGTELGIDVLGTTDHDVIVERMKLLVPQPSKSYHDPDGSGCFSYSLHVAPKFNELARDVQDCIKEYIAVRLGINKANVDFLFEYMIKRPAGHNVPVKQMRFMQALKKFVSQQVY